MSFSINEIRTLSCKAAVGAGFPPAQSDSFGRAAVWHLAQGGAGADVLAALDDPADSPILRLHLLPDDILRARALAGPDMTLSLQPGDEALAPSYARLAGIGFATCQVTRAKNAPPRLNLRLGPDAAHLPARVEVSPEVLSTLKELAARGLVPATQGARGGAGAGDIDND
ncbi:hypothetical protein [Tropicibacter naphthalenivorans]|uniref:hypothetical protein n=1 Tax=Tropicibacter naphthalenivorans TaxID=441103 RepID=UPI00117E741B|nr:hypothetical protein [Tropicibacter naphthalenivorans]